MAPRKKSPAGEMAAGIIREPGTNGQGQPPPALGHNQLSDDETAVLFFQHKRAYSAALDEKKIAAADFLNICKLAKAELGEGVVADIKTALELDSEEGEAKIRAAIEAQLRVASWMNVPLGSQSNLFAEPDRTPSVDRAYAAGKTAGLAGETLSNPHAHDLPQHARYDEGWRDGQAVHLAKIKASSDDADMRPAFLRDGDGAPVAA